MNEKVTDVAIMLCAFAVPTALYATAAILLIIRDVGVMVRRRWMRG